MQTHRGEKHNLLHGDNDQEIQAVKMQLDNIRWFTGNMMNPDAH